MQGIWSNDLFEYHGEFADFEPLRVRCETRPGIPADLLQRAQGPEALRAGGSPNTASRAGSGSRTRRTELQEWRRRHRTRARGAGELALDRRSRGLQHDLVRHHRPGGWTRRAGGQGHQPAWREPRHRSPRRLKRYNEAGLTMPMLWPPFADVPVVQDAGRPQAPQGGDHAEGRSRLTPQPALPTPARRPLRRGQVLPVRPALPAISAWSQRTHTSSVAGSGWLEQRALRVS